MRFSKAPLIATLMAAALALLIILPAAAAPGRVEFSDVGGISTVAIVVDPATRAFTSATGLMTNVPTKIDNKEVPAETKIEEGNTYVSNDSSAYNVVLFKVGPVPGVDDRLVSVKPSSGSSKNVEVNAGGVGYFKVLAQETSDANIKDEYPGVYNLAIAEADKADKTALALLTPAGIDNPGVIDTTQGQAAFDAYLGGTSGRLSDINAREIEAVNGDTITIDGNVTIHVDGRAPSIDDVEPADRRLQDDDRVDFSFSVTDDGSGLRSDRDSENLDKDSSAREPLAGEFGYGVDIGVFLDDKDFSSGTPNLETPVATAKRVDNRGNEDWNEDDQDHSYSVDFRTKALAEGTHEWFILARDRAGNVARYPSDDDDFFKVTVDETGPDVADGDLYAGIGYDDGEEVYDSSSIAIIFSNEAAHGLDAGSIDAAAFRVVGNSVVDVIYPGNKLTLNEDKTKCDSDTGLVSVDAGAVGGCINTLNRVYLVLGSPLDDDETPEVQISSSQFTDRADNGNENVEEDAVDRLPPTLTVTVVGDASADGRPLAQDEITVRVESGEPLLRRPSVWLVSIDSAGNIDKAGLAKPIGAVTGQSMAWESDFDAGDFAGLSGGSDFGAIIIQADDRSSARNRSTTTGWKGDGSTPADDDKLDLAKLDAAGLLVEFDDAIPDVAIEVTPNRGNIKETESGNPFVKLTFDEGDEYGGSVKQGDDKTDGDSYDTVIINSITLNGDDVSTGLASIDDSEFNLSLRGLAVGEYTLEITAMDTAGNEETWEEDFEVLKRSAYKVSLRPGWNLVSIPANPEDTAIGAVLPASHPASQVLSYQRGEWVTAARDPETGEWAGTLTDIVAGLGYFIETGSFDDLSTLIPEADPTTQLPVVPVVSGWNLLGVVDIDQAAEGATREADDYMASIDWSVAYGFDTTRNSWAKILDDGSSNADCDDDDDTNDTNCVANGSGYWVWATKAGTLVP